MATIAAVLLFGFAAILQNTVVTRVNLLVGAADLVLLVMLSWILLADEKNLIKFGVIAGAFIGLSSAVPFWVPVVSYSVVAGIVMLLATRIWQAPYWMLLTTTFFGTAIVLGMEIVVLWVYGYPFDFVEMLNIVVLPSIVLNILLVLPVYFFVGEVVKLVYPKEVEV